MKKNREVGPPTREKCNLFFKTLHLVALFILISVGAQAKTYSQSVKLNISLTNAPLSELVSQVKKQSDFTFFYNDSIAEELKSITIKKTGASIEEILKEVLKGKNITFEIKDKTIILSKSKPAEQKPQSNDVSGVVVDVAGKPLPGVTVIVKGTTTGAITGEKGEFIIKAPSKESILEFSYVGYKPQDIVASHPVMKVILKEEAISMDDVVVTGYQKIDRRLFTGSATKITGENAKIDGLTSIGQMLEGKAAGVSVQTVSGTFGTAPKIKVRGASSIFGDSKPLWVVDGVVLEDIVDINPDDLSSGDVATLISSAVAGLNTDDIESFQVLKDASATALYGAKAMNGVIVITTKRGKNGVTRVSYTGEFSMRLKPTYSDYNMMNSRDQMSVYRELETKGWLNHAEISKQKDGGIYKKMYDLINTYDIESGEFLLENTPQARAKFLKGYEMGNTDWFGELFRNSVTQNHSLSLTGGTDKSNFYFSTSYYNDGGWSSADKVERYTINGNASVNIGSKVKVGFLTAGSFRKQKAPGTVGRETNYVTGEYTRDFDINPFSYALNTSRVLRPYDNFGNREYYRMNYTDFNIMNEMESNMIDMDMLDMKIQADLSYKIHKNLEFAFIGSVRYVKSTQEHKIYGNSNMAEAYRASDTFEIANENKYLFKDNENPNSLPYSVLPKGGFYNRTDKTMKNYYLRNSLNYNKTIADRDVLNVLVGQEIKTMDRQTSMFDGAGYQWDRGGIPFIDHGFIKRQLQSGEDYYSMGEYYDRYVAFFATASYSYNGKYTVNGTFRYDGSNLMGQSASARWLPTWNVSGSWNAKQEKFLENNELISHLLLRGTYGLTASMGPATNSSLVLRSGVTDRPFLGEKETSMYIDGLENKELTWEKQYELNVGFDLGMVNNRFNLSFDAYWRNGFDLIGDIKTSGIGGEFYKYANYADMKSNGVEFTFSTTNIQKSNFRWTTNLTFSYNKNKITNLLSEPSVMDLIRNTGGALEGYPVRGLFSYQFTGLNNEGLPTFINQDGNPTVTDINFQTYSVGGLVYEGAIDPPFTGGFGNTFTYKGFKLNVFMTYQMGNKIRLNSAFKGSYTDLNAMPKEFHDRWMVAGDENITNVPVILSKSQYNSGYRKTYNAYNMSTERVASGSFIRMKELSLSYDLPKRLLDKIGINNASLKFLGTNLFLIYSDKKLNGQDPEFMSTGGVAMPIPKQFTLTLRVGI